MLEIGQKAWELLILMGRNPARLRISWLNEA